MFRQKKRWSSGTVRHEGRKTEISVPPPASVGQGVVLALIFLPMFLVAYLAFSPTPTPVPFLLRVSPGLVFGLVVLWISRDFFEREYAEQVVTVIPGKVIWTIKTRWWTRHREFGDVHDFSALTSWDGFGRVVLRTRDRQYVVIQWVVSEEAIRLASELKRAVNR
jgi:hypothetical protein